MNYLLKRLAYGIVVLFGVVMIIFALFNALPDPARLTQGQRTDPESIELVRKELGLDKDSVLSEMQSSDYENTIQTFDKYFGSIIDLER